MGVCHGDRVNRTNGTADVAADTPVIMNKVDLPRVAGNGINGTDRLADGMSQAKIRIDLRF